MISTYDVIKTCERWQKEGVETWFHLSEDKKQIIANDDGRVVCTVGEFVQYMRKEMHCDFESIYDEHPSLFHVIRCKECGCVIFTYEDDRYDHNLCCPVCAGYETSFKYWTQSDIDADVEKQNAIESYKQMTKAMQESYERRQKRGLCDWEICKKTIQFGKNIKRDYILECSNFFRSKNIFKRLKNLNLHIVTWEKDKNGMGYVSKNFTRIPLSPYAAYIKWVVPYRKNAPAAVKKYYPWQKRAEKTI